MSQAFSLDIVNALTGRTIIRVGDKGLHLDNGTTLYLSNSEIKSINDYYAANKPEPEQPKKRYLIRFSERAAIPEAMWELISTEEYDERKDATERFTKAVQLCHNSIDSVNIVVIDTKRLQYLIEDEEILSYTKIVD